MTYELGVDVSKWQTPEKVDWRKLRDEAGVRFVIARYAYGNLVDASFWKHGWLAHAAGGIAVGGYQYLVSTQDAGQQAGTALQIARHLTIPFVLDVEQKGLTKQHIDAWLFSFMRSGLTPMIYTSRFAWAECYGSSNHEWGRLPLWVANYTTAPKPALPLGWSEYKYWQYSQSGRLNGYGGDIDCNRKVI